MRRFFSSRPVAVAARLHPPPSVIPTRSFFLSLSLFLSLLLGPTSHTFLPPGVVADASARSLPFTLFPRCAALSCMEALRDDEDAIAATRSVVAHDPAPPVSLLQRLARALARHVNDLLLGCHLECDDSGTPYL